jgi:hypothetical protein
MKAIAAELRPSRLACSGRCRTKLRRGFGSQVKGESKPRLLGRVSELDKHDRWEEVRAPATAW